MPHVDARLEFDLRTACGPGRVRKGTPKRQPQWLEAAFDVLGHKRSDLQFGIGARFPIGGAYDAEREIIRIAPFRNKARAVL